MTKQNKTLLKTQYYKHKAEITLKSSRENPIIKFFQIMKKSKHFASVKRTQQDKTNN